MVHQPSPKFGQTSEEVDGRTIFTVPGSSADFQWKLTPGSPALLWTDGDYDVLENCQEIRFSDMSVAIDDRGQITTTSLEPAASEESNASDEPPATLTTLQ